MTDSSRTKTLWRWHRRFAPDRRHALIWLGAGGVASALGTRALAQTPPRAAPTSPVAQNVTFTTRTTHALSLFGDVKYPATFEHFDYVNLDAPKGGTVRLPGLGSFDSFNPFSVQGQPALGIGLIYDALMASSLDEPATEYGLLAREVEVPDDYSWATYTLRDEARFHDGTPVTPEDVIWSLNALKEKGQPFYRFYYANIVAAEQVGSNSVKFSFSEAGNRELPQITGQLIVLPKAYWEGANEKGVARDFSKGTIEPPIGSGPYRIGRFEAGRFVEYERAPDYWGKDLPVNVGSNNFDRVRFVYFRDGEIAFQGFLANEYDIRRENVSKNWAERYDTAAVKDGRIIREEIEEKNPNGMQGFFFNLRRAKFQDPLVRQAFAQVFNFEWTNKQIFFGLYERINSYYENSELAATGLPSEAELKLLNPYKDQVPEEVFTTEFRSPQGDPSGQNRENLREALRLFNLAGYETRDGKLVDMATGDPFQVQFLENQPSFDRIIQPYLRDLEKLGIDATVRFADSAEYENRMETFDFDITTDWMRQSLSPGNEQREFFGSEAADRPGSRNTPGIKNPVVDALIENIVFAEDREALITATRALDRVLLWNWYCVPQYYSPVERYAYWNTMGHPEEFPPYNVGVPTIWWDKTLEPTSEDGA